MKTGTEPTDLALIERYNALKGHVATQKEAFDNYLKPYMEGMESIENELLKRLNDRGADNTKTDAGTAYKSTLLNVKIVSREKFLDYVLENWDVIGNDMLMANAQKDAVKQFLENSNGVPPPGLECSWFTRINIRKS